jgi:hypothetical protein
MDFTKSKSLRIFKIFKQSEEICLKSLLKLSKTSFCLPKF